MRLTGLPVRLDHEDGHLYMGPPGSEVELKMNAGDMLVGHLTQIAPVGATEFRNAMWAGGKFDSMELFLSETPLASYDYEYAPLTRIAFITDDGELRVAIDFDQPEYVEVEDQAPIADAIREALAPLLARHGSRFVKAYADINSMGPPWPWTLFVAAKTRGRKLGEIYADAEEVVAFMDALTGGGLARETVLELLRAGKPEVLIGQPEGAWLDVKRQDYDLASDSGKISLAQDVARFANAEYGGIVVVGMSAKKVSGGEIIHAVTPVPVSPHGMRRHRQAIDTRLFPPPDELTVEEIEVDGGAIIVVHVPPQPEEHKPFLVHGAIVGGKVEVGFISIVRRRGEESIPIRPESIHGMLAAGRALMRRGEILPNRDQYPGLPSGPPNGDH